MQNRCSTIKLGHNTGSRLPLNQTKFSTYSGWHWHSSFHHSTVLSITFHLRTFQLEMLETKPGTFLHARHVFYHSAMYLLLLQMLPSCGGNSSFQLSSSFRLLAKSLPALCDFLHSLLLTAGWVPVIFWEDSKPLKITGKQTEGLIQAAVC